MKWCRYQLGGQTSYGIVEDHGYVVEVSGNLLGENKKTDISHPLDLVKILALIIPSMLYGAGRNYRGHAEGMAAR